MADATDPQARQKLLLGAMLFVGLGYLAFTYVYQPRAAEIAAMESRLEQLQSRNQAARRLAREQGRDQVERRLAVYRDQLSRVENLIPSSEELPDLLDAISAEAQRTGVQLTLIQPVGARQEEFYTRRTYELAVEGSYHQIGDFLTRVGSLPRIITPVNLNVAIREQSAGTGAGPALEAKFAIETYVLPSVAAPADSADVE